MPKQAEDEVVEGDFLVAGIDGGGTTFKCALADANAAIVASARIPVSTPPETVAGCVALLRNEASRIGLPIRGLGLACFGPLNLDPSSKDFGALRSTPKLGWSGFNLREAFQEGLGVPVAIDTDVNGALAAEMAWGAGRGAASAAYITVGTGIGAGLFVNGTFVGRPSHPEFGHIRVEKHRSDGYDGCCVYHGACLEGMASAPALHARFGDPARLDGRHPAWDMEAFYLAQGCMALSLCCRLERIILGGGVMLAEGLLERVRTHYLRLLNGYLEADEAEAERLIVRAGLGDDAGMLGGVRLALNAAES